VGATWLDVLKVRPSYVRLSGLSTNRHIPWGLQPSATASARGSAAVRCPFAGARSTTRVRCPA